MMYKVKVLVEYSRPADNNWFEVSWSFFVTPGFQNCRSRAKSGPRSHFVAREDISSLMKKWHTVFTEKLVDLVECNIYRNNQSKFWPIGLASRTRQSWSKKTNHPHFASLSQANPSPKSKNVFLIEPRRLAACVEGLSNSLAIAAGEL